MEAGIFGNFDCCGPQPRCLAITWAAWGTYMERCSDTLTDVSPPMGVAVQQPQLHEA